MKSYLILIFTAVMVACNGQSIYKYSAETIDGSTLDFSVFKGKKLMIVNTASECGFTPQYKELQALHDQFKDSNFVIIGFPSNDFGGQEPGTNDEISTFCHKNYGVTFQMMGKIAVKGETIHPLYQFLTDKKENGFSNNEVKWNFQKYLIDENGKLVKVISSKVSPLDPEIVNWITED